MLFGWFIASAFGTDRGPASCAMHVLSKWLVRVSLAIIKNCPPPALPVNQSIDDGVTVERTFVCECVLFELLPWDIRIAWMGVKQSCGLFLPMWRKKRLAVNDYFYWHCVLPHCVPLSLPSFVWIMANGHSTVEFELPPPPLSLSLWHWFCFSELFSMLNWLFQHDRFDIYCFWVSYTHAFSIFVFAPVQRSWACFTWKSALEIRSLLLTICCFLHIWQVFLWSDRNVFRLALLPLLLFGTTYL